MPKGLLDNSEIDIPCPECGHKTAKSFGWLKTHPEFTCAGCDRVIRLDRDKLLGDLRKVDSSIEELKRTIDRLNKR